MPMLVIVAVLVPVFCTVTVVLSVCPTGSGGNRTVPPGTTVLLADPDVDAVYRLTRKTPLFFDRAAEPVVLASDTWTPFNSQNTLFYREAFPLLYLPCHVSFRMTDI